MSNLYRGPSKDASYQVLIHLGKRFQRRRFFRNQPIRNKNGLWWPCLLTDRDEMSNLYREPSIDASYQVSVHLAKLFQRRRFKKVRSAESSFGQKVWVNISHSTESDFVHFPMGHSFDCCLLLNKIKVSLKTVMYYFSTKSLSKYLTATFPTLHFLIASCF